MGKLKTWLKGANGWKRLWLVFSMLGLIYIILFYPFYFINSPHSLYDKQVEQEFLNSRCQQFLTIPFPEMTTLDSNETKGCTYILSSRLFDSTTPYTLEAYYHFKHKNDYWLTIFSTAGIGAIFALVLSAFTYFIGVVVTWVVAGFSKKS